MTEHEHTINCKTKEECQAFWSTWMLECDEEVEGWMLPLAKKYGYEESYK